MERVVVTGASSGIGAACVEVFQAEGAEVIGVDIAGSSNADLHLQLDLSSADCGSELGGFLESRHVDGLVNNAGVGLDKTAVETTTSDFDRVIAVNLRAPFLLATALQPRLAERNGFVVNVASVHAVATSQCVAVYAASKGGLVALTRALAIEWAPEIRVNSVLPGAVDTELLRAGLFRTESSLERLADRHPLKRVGTPFDVAWAILFLARNSFATGSTLAIDGGAISHLSTE